MISIVIPAFNEERLLPQCLKSLQNQDYTGDYEFLVVNNLSTDGTKKIARQFGAKVVSCSEQGVFYARKTGADAATGDIIAQADADTVYPSDWLSRIARHFETHPKSVALGGRYTYKKPPRWAGLEYVSRHLANLICEVLFGHPGCVSGANLAFRRNAYIMAGGYNPLGLSPDQWGIAHRLSKIGKVSYDHGMMVVTSQRRVRKPFITVCFDVVRNTARVFYYFLRHCLGMNQVSAEKTHGKKKPVRLPVRFVS